MQHAAAEAMAAASAAACKSSQANHNDMDTSDLDWLAERLSLSLKVSLDTARSVLENTPRGSTHDTQSPTYHESQEKTQVLNLFTPDLIRIKNTAPNTSNTSLNIIQSSQSPRSIRHSSARASRIVMPPTYSRRRNARPSLDKRKARRFGVSSKFTSSRDEYISACEAQNLPPIGRVLDSLSLQCLKLRHANINDKALTTIAAVLRQNRCITVLDLSENSIGDVGAVALGLVLCSGRTVVKHIGLGSNHIRVSGALAITEALSTSASLCALSLANNKLGDNFACGLAQHIRQVIGPAQTWTLDLSQNQIGPRGAVALGEAISAQAVSKQCSISNLNMSWNPLRSQGSKSMLTSLTVSSRLTWLDLSWCGIGDSVAPSLGELLQSTICPLQVLGLAYNRIGRNSAIVIGESLKVNSKLRRLHIGFNPLGIYGARALLNGVRENIGLIFVGIENSLGDEVCQPINSKVKARINNSTSNNKNTNKSTTTTTTTNNNNNNNNNKNKNNFSHEDEQLPGLWELANAISDEHEHYVEITVEFPPVYRGGGSGSGSGSGYQYTQNSDRRESEVKIRKNVLPDPEAPLYQFCVETLLDKDVQDESIVGKRK